MEADYQLAFAMWRTVHSMCVHTLRLSVLHLKQLWLQQMGHEEKTKLRVCLMKLSVCPGLAVDLNKASICLKHWIVWAYVNTTFKTGCVTKQNKCQEELVSA